MLFTTLLTGLALASPVPQPYPLTLAGGFGGSGGPTNYVAADGPATYGAFVSGRAILRLGNWALEGATREGFFYEDERIVGAIFLGGRAAFENGNFFRVGGAHNHETPLAIAETDWVATTLGTLEGIRHRTGLEVGVGRLWVLQDDYFNQRVSLGVDFAISGLFDPNGPPAYAFLGIEGTVGVWERSGE